MNWEIEKLSHNIVIFWADKRNYMVMLEYDFDIGGLREFSDYLVTKSYMYNGRSYNRDLPVNRRRYYRLLSMIPDEVWEKAYNLYK